MSRDSLCENPTNGDRQGDAITGRATQGDKSLADPNRLSNRPRKTAGQCRKIGEAPPCANTTRPSHLRPSSQEGSNAMLPQSPPLGNTSPDDIRDAAWNAVAVASIAYQEECARLRYMVDLAHRHGLTISDLAQASGFNEDCVLELLAEVA